MLCASKTAVNFKEEGYAVIEDFLPAELIERLRLKAMDNYDAIMKAISLNPSGIGIGMKNGYKEIVQRQVGRYEMTYNMEEVIDEVIMREEFRFIRSILDQIFDEKYEVIGRSLLMSLPGTKDQTWHQDGPHVTVDNHSSCHCLNIFIPLVTMSPELGPTDIRSRSHYLTRDFKNSFLLSYAKKSLGTIVSPLLKKGGALLFDYRVLHRGRGNETDMQRPVLVITIAKSWFKDNLNFPSRSVFDSDISVIAKNDATSKIDCTFNQEEFEPSNSKC